MPETEHIYIIPENLAIVRAFAACQSQWRIHDSGRLTGLDYAGCRAAVAGNKLKWTEVFKGIQTMEYEVMRIEGEQSRGG